MQKSPAVYLFYGTETYLIKEQINKLTKAFIPENERDINVITYDLQYTPLEEVVEEAETLPFFANNKLIIAKNSFFLTGQKNVKASEEGIKALERLLEDPIDYSKIIFWVDSEKLDERKKIVKLMKKHAYTKTYNLLKGSSLNDWIKQSAINHNVEISDKAVELLTLTAGQNLQLLSQEVAKMASYVGKGGTIDEAVVEELSIRTIEQNIFSLIEKVANLEIEAAFQLLYDLLKNKEEPIKIIILFARQFRLMLYAKDLGNKGYSGKQIASQLGVHPYAIQIALKQATRFSNEQLERILRKLSEIDYEIKSGKKDKIIALEVFMFYLKGLMLNKNN